MWRRFLLLIGLVALIGFQKAEAQVVVFDTVGNTQITADTVVRSSKSTKKKKKSHSPTAATIMSACLPGLGQVYNGKWWKVPIVYAGFGGLGYMVYSNYSNYRLYLEAYEYSTGDLTEVSEQAAQLAVHYSSSQLQTYKESYRRDFELFTIITVAWYGLNILDACVDGHLYTYDISDDLSFSVDPYLRPYQPQELKLPQYAQVGLSFQLNF
jgi:hypothetical protein